MHAQSSSASIRLTSKPCRHPRDIDSEVDEERKKIHKADDNDIVGSRLRFVRALLKEQFENVEAVYEGYRGTYEIVTDAGLEAGVLDDEGKLKCFVTVECDDAYASIYKITVVCQDQKIAANVQTTLQNAFSAATAIKTKL